MPRHKAAHNCKILPWLSAKHNCEEGRFFQLGNSLLLSNRDKETGEEKNSFLILSASAKFLYLSMCMESGGKRQFEFPLKAAKKYAIPERSFRRCIDELIEAGFIKRQSGRSARMPNLYEFCFDWKYKERPP